MEGGGLPSDGMVWDKEAEVLLMDGYMSVLP